MPPPKQAVYTVQGGQVDVSTLKGSLTGAMASQNTQPNAEADQADVQVCAEGNMMVVRTLSGLVHAMDSAALAPSGSLRSTQTLRKTTGRGTLPTSTLSRDLPRFMSNMQKTLSPLQGSMKPPTKFSLKASEDGASVPLQTSAMSKLTGSEALSTDTHRIWLDTLSFCPVPAIVTAGHSADAAGHPVLFANAAAIGMLGRDLSRLASQTAESLLSFDEAAAALLARCLPAAVEFTLPFRSTLAGPRVTGSHLVALPISDLAVGGASIAHLLVFLNDDTATEACKNKLASLPSAADLQAAGYDTTALSGGKAVRRGIFADAAESNGTEALQTAALQNIFWSALGRRAKGRAPLAALPSMFDPLQWLEKLELLLTCALPCA